MASAKDLAKSATARLLIEGYPGSGKTGALCSLANAGLKLRVLSYDSVGNMQPLFQFTDKDKLDNIDIVICEDKVRNGPKFMEPVGLPTAFAEGLKMMDRWKYTKADGTEVDLGASKDWGPDTVVVLDSLTAMGECAKRRAMVMLNKTPLNSTQQMWGLAMSDQQQFLSKLLSDSNKFHVIVLAHLKMIGPKDVTPADADVTKEIKEKAAELIPTRLYPSALGQQLPPMIAGMFGCVLLAECKFKGSTVTRQLKSEPRPELDLKIPSLQIPKEVDITDGLLTVFKALTGGPEQWFAKEEK